MLRELQTVEEAETVLDGKISELTDVLVAHSYCKVLVAEPFALADGALHLAHILLYLIFRPFA